jgi:hypothetical protein
MMVYFREEQKFEWFWTVVWLVPVAMIGYGLYQEVISSILLWPALVVTVVVAVWINRLKLITEVRSDVLWIHFVLLWPERSIAWNEIQRAEAITYRPVKDFGGWGVRWAARGVVYNARGKRGVRMVLVSGERVLVGSQRAEDLARAIGERTKALKSPV